MAEAKCLRFSLSKEGGVRTLFPKTLPSGFTILAGSNQAWWGDRAQEEPAG